MQTGTIKKLIRFRGFGFIATADGKEIFFHQNSLQGVNFDSLKEGQTVQFDVERSNKGPCAVNVSVVQE